MHRRIIYPGAIPLETDLLFAQKSAFTALGDLAAAVLGNGYAFDGFACTPTIPSALSVNIAPGSMYVQGVVDQNVYSSLGSDTQHTTVLQGQSQDTITQNFAPPIVSGQSVTYLIQAALAVVDDDPVVLPYYDADNPDVAYQGPNNSGVAENVTRYLRAVIGQKSGIAAVSGTQIAPTPDPGYVGLFTVTVAYGQNQITTANIAVVDGAPFIPVKLPDVPDRVQQATWSAADDTGSVNTLAVALSPKPRSYTRLIVYLKPRYTNTGAATLNVNGLGARSIVNHDGSPLNPGDLRQGCLCQVMFDGANFVLLSVPGGAYVAPSQNSLWHYGDDVGIANALSVTASPLVTTLTNGLAIEIGVGTGNTNTGATTLSVSGLASKPVVRPTGAALAAGDILAGSKILVAYTAATDSFQLLSVPGTFGKPPQTQVRFYGEDTSTTAGQVVASVDAAVTAYAKGLTFDIKIANSLTGTSATLNINGIGALPITRGAGGALLANDMLAGYVARFVLDGAEAQLTNPLGSASTPSNGGTAGTDINGPLAGYWFTVIDILTAPPTLGTSDYGKAYIVGIGATGAWSGLDGKVAMWTSTGWVYRAYPANTVLGVMPGTANAKGLTVKLIGSVWTPVALIPVAEFQTLLFMHGQMGQGN